MAETIKMSAFTETATLNDNDYVIIIQDGENKKIKGQFVKSTSSGGGTSTGTGENSGSYVETLNVKNDDYIHIIQDGTDKKTKVVNIKGADNLTSGYVELEGDDGSKYRMKIVDGKPYVYPAIADTATAPVEGDNVNYDGLLINQIYGGGSSLIDTPVSHSFIELYNLRTESINLKGLYLWYRAKSGSWQSLELNGVIPPYHSFLIRCGEHNDIHKECVRCAITNYDMSWDIKLSNQGFSVYLCIGDATPEDNPVRVVKDALGHITSTNGRYIDLIGAGGKSSDQTIWAYETYYWNCMDENTALHRIDFANGGTINIGSNKSNKGNNQGDCEPIDYKTCNVDYYRPKCLADGEWGVYRDKTKFKDYYPNAINISYGKDGNTSRTFAFQTLYTKEGFVRYRISGTNTWTEKETNIEIIKQYDYQISLHRCIIHNLTPGSTYEYQVGYEGCWSDINTFEMTVFNESNPIKILWTTDEQGWGLEEYEAVKTCAKNILNWETDFDIHLNTGDISQNASRYFEWLDYYKYYGTSMKTKPHIIACGNNDLIDKKYSTAWNYYITSEDPWSNSVYSFDLGFTHFVCLNSNTDYLYVDGQGSIGGYASTDAYLQAQAEWLDQHLTEVESRETKPRWVVCYVHLSPFTVSRTLRLQRWIPIFEKHKVPLVLCGHNHAWSRSKALYTGYDGSAPYNNYTTKQSGSTDLLIVDEYTTSDGTTPIKREEDLRNGTHYILMGATGYKVTGKEKCITLPDNLKGTIHDNGQGMPWWLVNQKTMAQPMYGTVEIGYDTITIKSIEIQNVLTKDENKNITVHPFGEQTQNLFDTLTINHSDRE